MHIRAAKPGGRGEPAEMNGPVEMYADSLQSADKRIGDANCRERSGSNDGTPMRRQVPTNCAQCRPRIVDEVQHAAADNQIELATELERLQSCLHDIIEPRARDGEHLRAALWSASRDSRNPCGRAREYRQVSRP